MGIQLHFISTGSAFNKCAYNGQQCCSEILIQLIDQGFRALVEKDEFNFTSGLAGAQAAIDEMRDKIDGMYCVQILAMVYGSKVLWGNLLRTNQFVIMARQIVCRSQCS